MASSSIACRPSCSGNNSPLFIEVTVGSGFIMSIVLERDRWKYDFNLWMNHERIRIVSQNSLSIIYLMKWYTIRIILSSDKCDATPSMILLANDPQPGWQHALWAYIDQEGCQTLRKLPFKFFLLFWCYEIIVHLRNGNLNLPPSLDSTVSACTP